MGVSIHSVVVFVWSRSIWNWMLLWKLVVVFVGLLYSMGGYSTPRLPGILYSVFSVPS